MGLNISKGNMYSFVTHTWNTIKGECPHGCTYCYMHRWGKQKPVRFDESELKIDLGNGNFIFVGSSCDMFADDIPAEWIIKTLKHCNHFNNTYLFQTKDPKEFNSVGVHMPSKIRLCTTIETNRWYPLIMGKTPKPEHRSEAMFHLANCDIDTYITIEPIMDFDLFDMVILLKQCKPKQINIGADSSHNNLPEPSKEKILLLIEELEKFAIINQKKNLNRLLK